MGLGSVERSITSRTAMLLLAAALGSSLVACGTDERIASGFRALSGYSEYVPTQVPTGKAPLVVAIHGCSQNASSFAASTGWNELAETYGFYVLYPDKNGGCWSNRYLGGYSQAEVDQVVGYISQMQSRHPQIDPQQIYVMGLSAGTGLTNCLLVKKPGLFAGGAPMSGPGCTSSGSPSPSAKILIWHTSSDYYSTDLPSVFSSYGQNSGGSKTVSNQALKSGAKSHSYDAYTVGGEPRVGMVTLAGMGHGTACDPGTAEDQGGCLPGSSFAFDWDLHSAYYTAKFWGILQRDADPEVSITSPASGATVDVAQPVVFRADASDDQAVARVTFSVDGRLLCDVSAAPYSCTWTQAAAAANGAHSLSVIAEDSAGQTAHASVPFTVVNGVADLDPPNVSFVDPAEGASVQGSTTLTAQATDDFAVTKVEFSVDGQLRCTETQGDAQGIYSCTLNFDDLTPGPHSLMVKAYDAAGNHTSATRNITSKKPAFTCREFTASNQDHVAAQRAELYYYNVKARAVGSGDDLGLYYTQSATLAEIAPGYFIKGSCPAGADTQAPTVAITSPTAQGTLSQGAVQIEADASDNVAVVKVAFYVDGQKVAEDSQAPFVHTWQATAGSHTLKVVASDAAGNDAQDSVTVTVSSAAFTCRSFTSTNLEHVAAGRAEEYTQWLNAYTRTIGGGDDLGLLGSVYYSATTTVSETQPGHFIAGSCP